MWPDRDSITATSHTKRKTISLTCGSSLTEDITRDANDSNGFPIQTDETTYIVETEQMSIGVQFTEIKSGYTIPVTEGFLDFVAVAGTQQMPSVHPVHHPPDFDWELENYFDFQDFVKTVFCCGKLWVFL